MSYRAPLKDLLFNLEHLGGLAEWSRLPGFEGIDKDTAASVLEECARFTQEVVAPLSVVGDRQPATCDGTDVYTSPGFAQAYRHYVEGGWQGLAHPTEVGGQGLPKTISAACIEMLQSADLSFGLCPMLTDGAIEALLVAGSDELKNVYLEKLVSGQWSGTMNLTEPQAGSDLSLIRTRADAAADGSWRINGTKIFITWGEHGMAENIVHLVLARMAGAPAGIKGISLFVVPKFLPRADGRRGARNDVRCVSIEHKLGIKASPTAVLQFGGNALAEAGEGTGAVGYLMGEANRGLEYMFIMMNAARFAVGVQGVAVAERAYQKAVAYAHDRVQSRPVDGSARESVAIVRHPDVQRMLLTMRALTEGSRAMACAAAAAHDLAHHHPDAITRDEQRALYEFLVPLVKGYSTEMSLEVTSLAVQVHGGMGFIEETGVAQHYRDARILTIYEGTTAIQANDLVGRKTVRDGGAVARAIVQQTEATEGQLVATGGALGRHVAQRLGVARAAFLQAVHFIVAHASAQPNAVYAGAVPYLMLAGNLVAGWQLARAMLAAHAALVEPGADEAFLRAKIATAHFYAVHVLPRTSALADTVTEGASFAADAAAMDWS